MRKFNSKSIFVATAVWLSLSGAAFADVTLNVSYAGGSSSYFNKDYYVNKHLPLVQKAWGPHGLEACSAFFPDGYEVGVVAVAICKFRDQEALEKAFKSSATGPVLDDVKNFTDIQPTRTIATPF